MQQVPFLVLAAQLCPVDIEATFYASIMSLSNSGKGISSLWGGLFLNWLHIVKVPRMNSTDSTDTTFDFTNLTTALWIRSFLMLAPAFLALCMLPNSSNAAWQEDIEYESFGADGLDNEDGDFPLQEFEENADVGLSRKFH